MLNTVTHSGLPKALLKSMKSVPLQWVGPQSSMHAAPACDRFAKCLWLRGLTPAKLLRWCAFLSACGLHCR